MLQSFNGDGYAVAAEDDADDDYNNDGGLVMITKTMTMKMYIWGKAGLKWIVS